MKADFGAGRLWGTRTRIAQQGLPAARELTLLLEPLGIEYCGNDTLGGADLLPLLRYRVPLIELRQYATNYFDVYHSANDTLDKVSPKDLAKNVAAYAVGALVAAEFEGGFGRAPKFLGRLPWPIDQIAEGKAMPR